MSPTIVIAYKPGELGNRLLQFATFIAFSEKTGVRVVNLSFDEYAPLFETTRRDALCRYPFRRSRLPPTHVLRRALFVAAYYAARVIARCKLQSRLARVISLDWGEKKILDESFLSEIQTSWLVLIQGWRIFVPPGEPLEWCGPPGGIEPHAKAIRRYFRPRSDLLSKVDALAQQARRGCDRVIGVHIRQGDFLRDKNQGRYYYSTEQYVEKMREVRGLYAGEEVGFLVCSNARQPPELFSALRCTFGGQDPVVDLYSLARCDAIMGPPSSFSQWAAFIGGRRFCWIFDVQEKITDRSFVPFAPVDQDEYAERFYGYQDAKRGRRGAGTP